MTERFSKAQQMYYSDSMHLRSENRRPGLENKKQQRVLGGRILLDKEVGVGDGANKVVLFCHWWGDC